MGEIPENMYSLRHVPWHRNAEVGDVELTAKAAMIAAGLDLAVSKVPVFVANNEHADSDTYSELDGFKAVVRDDDGSVFQIATDAYNVVQNHETFAFFDKLTDGATIQTAFDLKHGAIVCISALLDRQIDIGTGADSVMPYIIGVNSHNSSLAFGVHIAPTRPVCENTLNLSLRQANTSWKAKHTASIEDQVASAQKAMGLAETYYDAFEAEANRMISTELTKREFETIIRRAFPGKAIGGVGGFSQLQYQLIGTFESSPTIPDEYRYTQWGAVNAVGEHADWAKRTKADEDDDAADNRTFDSLFGKAPKTRDAFYQAMVAA